MTTDDPTEDIRRKEIKEINSSPKNREELELLHGKVLSTQELAEEFEVLGFLAPYAVVKRKKDDVVGSFKFQHSPRYYFEFMPD